ncbi:glycosyltransferase family 2 protein [Demequina aurantiaca]|uniref:glycosyltransferase family 2 protein n=1 Tax=Demequina aurantiaca TaxID=676200 RepID=UPI003D3296C1
MYKIPSLSPAVVDQVIDNIRRDCRDGRDFARRLARWALRDGSDAVLNVVARGLSTTMDWDQLVERARPGSSASTESLTRRDGYLLRAAGRIVFSHATENEHQQLARSFFDMAGALDGDRWLSLAEYRLRVQVLWVTGGEDLIAGVPIPKLMDDFERHFLTLDLMSLQSGVRSEEWLKYLNRYVFRSQGNADIVIGDDSAVPFDCLDAADCAEVADGPLVSVIMTTFQRRDEIIHAVNSILRQSWWNIELIVVDDFSSSDFASVLDAVEVLDSRIRVIRLKQNGGTYIARNTALQVARGEYVTFQDDDDWSHPQRIQRQVELLIGDPGVNSVLSTSLRASDALQFRFGGVAPTRTNASSLMFRRSALDVVGGFDTVRKGADSELISRLRIALPGRQVVLPEVLSFVRLSTDSLSRTDFRVGWSHPSRAEYWDAAKHWHGEVALGHSPKMPLAATERAFPAPRRFLGAAAASAEASGIDIVVVGDFSGDGAPGRMAWHLLSKLLSESTATVGLADMNSMGRTNGKLAALAPCVRRLLSEQRVTRVLPGDELRVQLLVVTDPALLEFAARDRWGLAAQRVVTYCPSSPLVVAASSPWDFGDFSVAVKQIFGSPVDQWIAASARIAEELKQLGVDVARDPMPMASFVDPIRVASRRTLRTPVIGRITGSDKAGWPESLADVNAVYPDTGEADVRIFGSVRAVENALGEVPARWLHFAEGAVSVDLFIQQLDFYVHQSCTDTLEQPCLDAMLLTIAAGRILIVDRVLEPVFEEAAVYATPKDALVTVRALYADRDAYAAQVARARKWLADKTTEASLAEALVLAP